MENKPVLNRREVKRQKTAKTIKGAAARIVIMTAVLLIASLAVLGINKLTDYIHEKNYRALSDAQRELTPRGESLGRLRAAAANRAGRLGPTDWIAPAL